jgi:hypothetical protein
MRHVAVPMNAERSLEIAQSECEGKVGEVLRWMGVVVNGRYTLSCRRFEFDGTGEVARFIAR